MKKTKKSAVKKANAPVSASLKKAEPQKTAPVVKKEPAPKAPVAAEKTVALKTKETKGISFVQTFFYLLALFVLFQAGLFVYLTQSSNMSMRRNYRFMTRHLTSCYAQSTKCKDEMAQMKRAVDEPKCPAPQDRHEILNPEEYAPYEKGGSAVIEGDLCFTLEDGVKKCFDRAQVFINPVTSYSDEWYHRGWAGREALKVPDERAVKMNKMTLSDKNGKYKFEGLAAGSYYVGAVVCVPKKSTDGDCVLSRYAAKVSMKNRVKPKLKRVYP